MAAASPAAVLAQCDITFAMLSDPAAAEAVVFGPGGVLEGVTTGKGYVDMSTGALAATQRSEGHEWRHARARARARSTRHAAAARRQRGGDVPRGARRLPGCGAGSGTALTRARPAAPLRAAAVDAETSRKIGAAVTAKGGRFLEAPVSGSKKPAIGARRDTRSAHRGTALTRLAAAQTGSW